MATRSRSAGLGLLALVLLTMAAAPPLMGCDPGAPYVVILSPHDGQFRHLNGGTAGCVQVDGQFGNFDATANPIWLHVNQIPIPGNTTDPDGVMATILPGPSRSSGQWTACVPIGYAPTATTYAQRPVNTIFATAPALSPPPRTSVTVSVGKMPGEWVTRAGDLALQINLSGIHLVKGSVIGAFTSTVDLEAMVMGWNPIIQNFQVAPGVVVSGNVTDVRHSAIQVDVLPLGPSQVNGNQTLVTIRVPSLAIDFLATDSIVNPSLQCAGTLSAQNVEIHSYVDQIPNGPLVDVNQTSLQTLVIPGWVVTFPQTPGNLCGYPTFQTYLQANVAPTLTNLATTSISTALADPDGPGVQDALVAGAIQNALADVSLAGAIEPTLNVTLNGLIGGVSETDTSALLYTFDVGPMPTQTLCATSGLFGAACPNLGASAYKVKLPPNTPSWGPFHAIQNQPIAVPYDIAFGLGPTAMNHLFRAMVMQGRLAKEITELPSCVGHPVGNDDTLTAECLFGSILPATGLAAGDLLRVRAWFVAPPTALDEVGPDGTGQKLVINGLMVQVDRINQPAAPETLLKLHVRLNASLELDHNQDGTQFTFGLGTCTQSPPLACQPDAWATTLIENLPGPILNITLLDLFLNFAAPPFTTQSLLESTILPLVATANLGFPVPTFGDFGLVPIDSGVDQGMQASFLTMYELPEGPPGDPDPN